MTEYELIVKTVQCAAKCNHLAGWIAANRTREEIPAKVTELLEQARGLNAAAQALELISRKHPAPVNG